MPTTLRRWACGLLAAAFLAPTAAWSQIVEWSPSQSAVDLHKLTEVVSNLIAKRVLRVTVEQQMPSWLPLFDSVKVDVKDFVRPGGIALAQDGKKSIEMNVGVTVAVHIYSEYATIRTHYPSRHNGNCKNYLTYLGEFYKTSARQEPEAFLATVVRPADYCGVPGLREDGRFREQAGAIFRQTLLPGLGLILGHEYAHHLLRHVPVKTNAVAKLRDMEEEAEKTGSVLFGTAASRIPAAIIFDLMARYRTSDPFSKARAHPPEECRFVYFLFDDARFTGETDVQRLLQPYRDRVDIMERITDMHRVAYAAVGGGAIPKCDLLR
ncbi:MAG TPA: hypothetical protein VGN82_17040 [Bosea sp. (in: a-proteobacteria)]|uniref:hypothetical protein n=1 Tax=Bosea sp. (in: a-proteobacteria) TaxID=1871050 RepID=UPI002E0E2546|nr:hypothetical protein [Bosea sp. (in: a-proteobacteria)]